MRGPSPLLTMILMSGLRLLTAIAIPAMRPAPPTGCSDFNIPDYSVKTMEDRGISLVGRRCL